MSLVNIAFLVTATAAFVAAAVAAKIWAISDEGWPWLLLTLGLYTIGNLVMLRLVKEMGMGAALSLSAVIQLTAINLLAVAVFGEHMTILQGAGLVLAVIAVGLITIPAGGR